MEDKKIIEISKDNIEIIENKDNSFSYYNGRTF